MDVENDNLSLFGIVKSDRLSDFKSRSIYNDQESRRFELLHNQKRRRENAFNEFRNVGDLFSEAEPMGELDEEPSADEEFMEWTDSKPKFPNLKEMFMFSEWMVKLPENFERKWLFVLCPVGKRCLVRCAKGCTTVYGKSGHQLAKFQSALPNGSQKYFEGVTYSNSEVTILDCIWNSQVKSYFVLDLLSWKGQFYMDTETSFRGFWIKSKLQEMPWLSERSDHNPFPFFPLDYHSCDLVTLSTILSNHPYFSFDAPKIDGILFYHSEAFYTPGSTPLVVWLKPFMVPEILRIEISESYMKARPSFYVDMNQYIEDYENKMRQKERRRTRNKRKKKQQQQQQEEQQEEHPEDWEEIKEVEMSEDEIPF